ncbi:tRNA pseudouridine(38-40) synthase TruA [Paenibacillus sp. MBLB4367]|uniref:tRNA pseudouridine(38-40) synthase TruA n=1 Tax=Paenibacillus sp. MBLB4367 TaxID=3384767 RepID=UPI0039080D42
MRNVKLNVSYEGTLYSGFQTQPHRNTIQDKLEEAVASLTGETVKIIGSGRTDAGVHARAQIVNFEISSKIPIERWCLAMNSRLPEDIVVYAAEEARFDFHARRSAKRKTYRYSIRYGRHPDLFTRRTTFHHHAPLNTDLMRQALAMLEGEHDFTSFCSIRSSVESHVRTIFETRLETVVDERSVDGQAGVIHMYITGNGFLYNMVRIIVGTLIEIGEGKRSQNDMQHILDAKDRNTAGPTAEPHGLMLWDVVY